jgi:hypothetical protein
VSGRTVPVDKVLVDYDINTALLAFAETDRGKFYGVHSVLRDNR